MKVLIGTKNPGKIKGAEEAFSFYFDDVVVEGIPSPSNVPEQPLDLDIYNGAKNRVENLIKLAKEAGAEADFFVSVESGMTNVLGKWIITNIAVIKDKNGNESWGTSAGFPVPEKYVEDIKNKTLGKVMDELFEKESLRLTTGGIGLLTDDKITRIELSRQAFVMALTQFINKKWNNF